MEANGNASNQSNTPCGIKAVSVFFIFHLLLVVIPAWSFFQYDLVATQLHLEEPRELADEAVVQANRAIGLTNCIWVIPLNVVAIVGLTCCGSYNGNRNTDGRRFANHDTTLSSHTPPTWAFAVSYMLLGISIYWTIQYIGSRYTYASADVDHVQLRGSDLGMLGIVLLLSLWSTYYLSSYQTRIMVINGTPAKDPPQNHPQSYNSISDKFSNGTESLLPVGLE